MRAWLVAAVLFACACGGGGSGTGDDDQPDGGGDGSDSGTEPGWQMLIERGWSLGAHQEDFKCIRVKVPTEMYISGFHVKSPLGTHHEILTVSEATSPVGEYDCTGANTDKQMLFAGGIGTNDMLFPDGVAIKLPANTYINLNLHIANFSDDPIECKPPTCSSGIEVKTIPASEVVHEADMMFLGTWTFSVPAGAMGWPEPGDTSAHIKSSCSIPASWTILSLWPHMHSYAKHQRVSVLRGNNSVDMLLDTDYTYMDQKNYPMTVPLAINDELRVECIYNNTSGYELTYGDGAALEMCFAGFYKYPAGGDKYLCAPMN